MMAAKRKKLWGYTRYGVHEIKIYKSYRLKNFDGLTYSKADGGYYIDIHCNVFDAPTLLDEILIHEFVHVVELLNDLKWEDTNDKSCSPAVRLLGQGLAQMLRELRQAGVED